VERDLVANENRRRAELDPLVDKVWQLLVPTTLLDWLAHRSLQRGVRADAGNLSDEQSLATVPRHKEPTRLLRSSSISRC
jgi:hypothetical protein